VSTTRRARGGRAWHAGVRAEALAAVLLTGKGFRIVERRFACPAGEIDIVARRGRLLVFVEVKARRDAATAAEAITPRQRRRIERAAEAFLQGRPDLAGMDLRFDAVVFGRGLWPRHITDAWRPDFH